MPQDPSTPRRVQRRWPFITGGVALALAFAVGGLIALRDSPLELDAEWMEEIVEHRQPFWEVPSLAMNFIGGGWFSIFVIPLGVAALFLILRKPWSALYFILASALSAGLVQLLKTLFGRARPEDMLVASDYGSFPSGHTANAATIAVVLGILLARTWVWVVGAAYVLLMALSRTYLGAHWVTDTIGGALVGVAVAVLLWAPLAQKLYREWRPGATVSS
jgi:undecaprenyl-diphosphatase